MDAKRVFKTVSVTPNFVEGHFIQWELHPFFRGARPYNFSVEIAQTIDFSQLIAVKRNLGDVFCAVDDFNLKQNWGANYHYRIILRTADGKIYQSHTVTFGTNRADFRKYAMAGEIIRKEFLACRYAGQPGWLLKRKSYGTKTEKVIKNLDPVSGVPLTDTKEEDYGVGIDGGYFDPVPCAFFLENGSQDRQLDRDGIGVKETYDYIIRLPGYPILEVRDVVCDAEDGYRYSVMARTVTAFPGSSIPIYQKATIRLISSTDTVYAIPIPEPKF